MRALVTGATGFLGGHLARALQARGWRVVAVGRNRNAGERLKAQGVDFYAVDLSDREELKQLPECEIVFHAAALSSAWGAYRDFHLANIVASENVMERCVAWKSRRLVHISTPSLYFDFRDRLDIRENDPLPRRFVNAYAATKRAAELLLTRAASGENAPSVAMLRPRGIFGEYDTALMPRLERVARRGRFPMIRGGAAMADVTYVGNVVDAALLAAQAELPEKVCCYNITNGEPQRIGDIIAKVLGQLFPDCRFINVPHAPLHILARGMEGVARLLRLGEPPLTAYGIGVLGYSQTLNIDKARRELGYAPKVAVAEGIERYVRWRRG